MVSEKGKASDGARAESTKGRARHARKRRESGGIKKKKKKKKGGGSKRGSSPFVGRPDPHKLTKTAPPCPTSAPPPPSSRTDTTAPAPAAAPAAAPPVPLNTVYTFVAATAALDRTAKTLTLTGLGPAVTGTVTSGGDAMPLRHALADVFGPATFLPIFAGPAPVQALLDGDAAGKGKPAGQRVALSLVPGSAKYDASAGSLTLGVAGEGPLVEEAAKAAGGVLGAALAHTGPAQKDGGTAPTSTLTAAALSIDVGVPQAAAGLARAKAKAAAAPAAAAAAKPATVAAASVPA